jgi:hypothetical protein
VTDIGDIDTMSVVLGHEAYRDGKTGADNKSETREAVIAHTKMAARMRAYGADFGNSVVGLDLAVYDYARSVGNMEIMAAYAAAFYKSEKDYFDFGFTVDPYGEVINFLSEFDTPFKFAGILDATSKGDPSAKVVLDNVADGTKDYFVEQGKKAAEAGATVADKVSTSANTVIIGSTLIGAIPVAIASGKVAFIADASGLVFSLMAGNEEKRDKFIASTVLDFVFKGISKFAPNYPVWNFGANRYRSSTTGRFINTKTGKAVDLIPPVTGSIVPPLFERNE